MILLVCVDINMGFAKNQKIPWYFKPDSQFFLDISSRKYNLNYKNAVIIGKNTWLDLPDSHRGLPGRITIIISNSLSESEINSQNNTNSEIYLVKNFDQALKIINNLNIGEIIIAGGYKIYQEALAKNLVDYIYITKINRDYSCDIFFDFNLDKYIQISNKNFILDDQKNNHQNIKLDFYKYSRNIIQAKIINKPELDYLNLLDYILKNGNFRDTRNSKTWSVFGKSLEFDLENYFPLLTTKKVFFRAIFEELIFFIKGQTNTNILSDKNINIWKPNTSREFLDSQGLKYEPGDMGPLYGFQFRYFGAPYAGMDKNYTGQGLDQIKYILNLIKTDPNSRRILLTSFNPAQVSQGVLWPCHSIIIQFFVENNKLSCFSHQRSADAVCGLPFNIASMALLVYFICEVINNSPEYNSKLIPGKLILSLGDTHIYESHKFQAIRQILREPHEFPKLIFNKKIQNISEFQFEDLILLDYKFDPSIPINMVI